MNLAERLALMPSLTGWVKEHNPLLLPAGYRSKFRRFGSVHVIKDLTPQPLLPWEEQHVHFRVLHRALQCPEPQCSSLQKQPANWKNLQTTNSKHLQTKGRVYLSWKQWHGVQRMTWLMLYWDFQHRPWEKPSVSECHTVPRPGLACLGRTENGLGAGCQAETLPLIQQIHCCAEKISRSWRKSMVMAIWGRANKRVIPPFLPHCSSGLLTVILWLAAGFREPWECSLNHPWGFGSSPPSHSPGKHSSATATFLLLSQQVPFQ